MDNRRLHYAIEMTFEDRTPESVSLQAGTDDDARKALRKYLAASPAPDGALVFLSFSRPADGQKGYINPDGASPTGKPWNAA